MNNELRKSGLEMIGDVPWGTHFCQFYQGPQDLLDILVPYFKAGLENNEFCMWVTSEPLGVEAARNALRSVLPDLETYVRRGQLEIIPHTDWYLEGGEFDADRVLDGWVRKLDKALAAGFEGLRLTGNTFWLEPKDWRAFTDYEASVDGVIGRYKMLAVCTYSVERCGFTEILDVIRNHRFALVRREGRWELVESAERRRAMDALQKSEEKFRGLFNSMTEGFALHEIVVDGRGRPVDYCFLDINPAFERLTGLRREETLGRKVTEVLPGIEPFWIQTYGRVALSGEPVTFERYYPAPLDRTYQTYAYRPAPGQFAVVFMDVSGRKRTEVALQESHEELEVTAEELRQQNEELLSVQQALLDSEERFHVALRNMPVTVATLDRDLKYTWVHNPRGGFDHQEVVGRQVGLTLGPEEGARLVDDLTEVLTTGRPLTKEALSTGKAGEETVFEIHAEPLHDRDGLVSGVAMVSLDITERKKAEERLALRTAITELLSEGGSVAEVAPRVLELVVRGLDFAAGELWLVDTDGERLRRAVFWEAPGAGLSRAAAARASLEFAIGEGIPGTVWSSGEPYWVADVEALPDPLKVESARRAGLRSFFAFPVRLGAGTLGVVGLAANEPRPLDPGAMQVVKIIGLQLGQFILRNRAEEALRRSEELLSFALETSRTGAWDMDLVDHSAFRSSEHDRIFGYAEMLPEWTYEMFLAHVLPEDRADVDAKFTQATAAGTDWDFECRIRRTDGETRWIWAAGRRRSAASGGHARMAGIVQDITERKRAEALNQALAEQERLKLGAAVEQASDAVIMIDLDGTIRYVNAAFESLNGVKRNEAIGRSYFEFLAAQSPSLDALREAVAQGRPWRGPLTGTVRGGQPLELAVTVSAIANPAGAVIGGLVTEKDVTRENALQRQFRQAQKMEALGTLAGGITHDFNNILGAIIINTELALLDLEPTHPSRRPLPTVLQAANRGKELVKQIITFSRQREWERQPMEIAPAVQEALKFLRATLSKEITIHETIAEGCGAILADPSHIHQIMVNLCQNAALAMQEGPGTLEIRLEPVETDVVLLARHPELKPGPYVRLAVSDTGCGIEREHLERIFEPFFTTRGPGRGSGLGLAVVHGIVKSYEGTISVYSEPGKGSVFTIYIPRLEGQVHGEPQGRPLRPLEGRERILLVDDEEPQRSGLALGLKRLGYSVTPRAGGRSALSLFRKDPAAFDIVITDQTMPRMSGLELAAEIVGTRPDLPVILCTGFSDKVNSSAVGRSGVRAFLMKPFTLQEITRLIREAVEKK